MRSRNASVKEIRIVIICFTILVKISQEDLCNYLLSINFETGVISSEDETEHMKKILNAVIKKLIKD
jgi:hypothetical protein